MDQGTTRNDCTKVSPLLGHYIAEKLDEATRLTIRAHLLNCPACSTEARRLDPSILFMRLGQEPAPRSDASWARFDARLRSRLEAEAGRRRGFFAGWDFGTVRAPRLAYAAPLAMLALLAGLMFVTQPGLIRGPRQVEGIRPPHEIGGPVRPTLDPRGPAGGAETVARASLRLSDDDASLLPTLEQVTSPAARVYRLDVGAPAVPAGGAIAGDSGAVYFVVDETINF
jgi:hypothetical protein